MAVTEPAPAPAPRDLAVKLADHAVTAARAYGRSDLATRLSDLRERAADPTVRVLVVGEFKQGKSSLVNVLVGFDVCPVDDDVATAVPTAIRYADQPSAVAIVRRDGANASEPTATAVTEVIRFDALPEWVCENGENVAAADVQLVDLAVPAASLRDGLVLVDLPGVGGLGSLHGALTLAALPAADAVAFVSDAAQGLTATELEFLEDVAARCPLVALVESKIDIHPSWRQVVDADTVDAVDAGPHTVGPFAVSSVLAEKAVESGDAALAVESGFGPLSAWLRDDVAAGSARRQALLIADVVGEVTEQLTQPFEAERAALAVPVDTSDLDARLTGAQAEVTRLRGAAGRWQQVMADNFSDLSGDLDHDLRTRIRDVVHAAEQALDTMDPAKAWDAYEPQLRREVAGLAGDHYATLDTRVTATAHAVAQVFTEDAATLDTLVREAYGTEDAPVLPAEGDTTVELKSQKTGLANQALTMLRSSYGSAAMIGFLGTAIGFPLAAPAALAVGLAIGARGMRQEVERQLAQRRAQAKAAVRQYVDEVSFVVGKDSRDRIRLSQRHLRDFFGARADELLRSAATALQAAQDATATATTGREERLRDVEAELARLAWLAQSAADVRTALQGESGATA